MPLSAVRYFEYQLLIPSNHGSIKPVPVTIQSHLVMVHGIISLKTALSEIIVLNDGVLKNTALLHSKVIISILPILIGTGHYRQPASLAPWFTPWILDKPVVSLSADTPPSHGNNVVYVGLEHYCHLQTPQHTWPHMTRPVRKGHEIKKRRGKSGRHEFGRGSKRQ